jgi:hypothetical protein
MAFTIPYSGQIYSIQADIPLAGIFYREFIMPPSTSYVFYLNGTNIGGGGSGPEADPLPPGEDLFIFNGNSHTFVYSNTIRVVYSGGYVYDSGLIPFYMGTPIKASSPYPSNAAINIEKNITTFGWSIT